MDVKQLEAFVAVAKYKSFSKAARELFLTQPTVSAHIQNLEKGLDTVVGERGLGLSGGQKQRIAVARAILRNPDILLFDEATASLDTKSEKIIQESINKVKDGKIVFVIAHRLSTVVDSDKILVMQDGKITGCGTHQELLSSHEFYNNLVNQQFVENKECV